MTRHHDPIAGAIHDHADAMRDVASAIRDVAEAIHSLALPVLGHFDMTAEPMEEAPMSPAPVDHTAPLELPSSSVRAKISVTNPRLPNGQRVAVTFANWSTDDETELPLEVAPDDTVKDAEGNEVLDEVDGLPLNIYSVYANTPLSPEAPAKADGTVTVSFPGMASCDKLVTYGDAPLGHFTMSGGEAPEA